MTPTFMNQQISKLLNDEKRHFTKFGKRRKKNKEIRRKTITMRSPPTTTATLQDQKFKTFQMMKNNVSPSLESGEKTAMELGSKIIIFIYLQLQQQHQV